MFAFTGEGEVIFTTANERSGGAPTSQVNAGIKDACRTGVTSSGFYLEDAHVLPVMGL